MHIFLYFAFLINIFVELNLNLNQNFENIQIYYNIECALSQRPLIAFSLVFTVVIDALRLTFGFDPFVGDIDDALLAGDKVELA